MTAFFPIFFKKYWSAVPGVTAEQSTAYLGIANSVASLMIALLAPLLGSIADQGNGKRKFLLTFTVHRGCDVLFVLRPDHRQGSAVIRDIDCGSGLVEPRILGSDQIAAQFLAEIVESIL